MDSRRGSAVSPAFGGGSRSSQGGSGGADVYNGGGGPGLGHVTASSNLSFGMTIVDTSAEQVDFIVCLFSSGREMAMKIRLIQSVTLQVFRITRISFF
jgi:hypothetical protein